VKPLVNTAEAEATGVAKVNDTASVTTKKDANCATPPTPPTPPAPTPSVVPSTPVSATLPQTGVEAGLLGVIGSSAMAIGAIKYRQSKKAVAETLKKKSNR
jgi:hypothetical protein